MQLHRVFKTEFDHRFIVYIPTSRQVLEVGEEIFATVPQELPSDIPLLENKWSHRKDFQFFGTNLLLTDKCDLACVYCYEDLPPQMFNVLSCQPRTIMDQRVVEAAISYIARCAAEAKAEKFSANMFGGEPTQAFNVLQYAVACLREKGTALGIPTRATITTNGAMNDSKAQWLADNMDGINVSFDGPKEIQDLHRSRSFDKVFRNVQMFYACAPRKLALRATVSDYSVRQIPEIIRFFGENFPGIRIALEPIFAAGRAKCGKFSAPDDSQFFEKFLEALPVAKEFGCRLKTSVLHIGGNLAQFCGVPGDNFMIAADGRVTVCNRMISGLEPAENRFIYGHYDFSEGKFVFDLGKYEWLKQLTVRNIPQCQDCFARGSCRGDCAANKAVLDPENFPANPSYRCAAIREFLAKILLYILDNGGEELVWRD